MTPRANVALTEGAVQVLALSGRLTASELARRVQASEAMIRHISTGRRKPGTALRSRFAELGIDEASWATLPAEPVVVAARRVPSVATGAPIVSEGGGSTIARLEETISELEEQIAEARGEAVPVSHIASLMRVKVSALDRLARLRCEGEITSATIRRSKAWQEMLTVIEGVLAKHPEAARDFATAFARIGGG